MSKKNILITGCNGFVGRYLTKELMESGNCVFGCDIQENGWTDAINYSNVDIKNYNELEKIIYNNQIHDIYHLAAVANPKESDKFPLESIKTNILGTSNLFEICRKKTSVKLLVVGSSEEYKMVDHDYLEFSEESVLFPRNIYGATKICAEILGMEYVRRYEAKIFFSRSFNHTGPGQASVYVLSSFAKQCAEIRLGKQKPIIKVGDISAARDFLDVRDVVKAYQSILERGKVGVTYNVCSGTAYKLDELLNYLISLTGLENIEVITDAAKIRKNEVPIVVGNNKKLKHDTGWDLQFGIKKTLFDLFTNWVEQLK